MKTAVVTGGAGFIGSHMVERLKADNYKVSIIDNFSTGRIDNIKHVKDITIEEANLANDGNWKHLISEANLVIHLASLADIVPSIENPVSYYESNVTGTMNVMEAARINKTKVIYAGSSSCYGIPDSYPTDEMAEVRPQYPYALTKHMGEEIVLHWGRVYGIKTISTRFFNVFGTRSRTSGTYGAVFGVFLAQKLAEQPFTVVGDGTQTRDFTYVTDVCEGMIKASNSNYTNEIFNIGSGKPKSINELTRLLGGEVVYIPKRPGEPDTTHANIDKAKKMLGYSPEITFEEGVQIVKNNINYWSDAPVWTPTTIAQASKAWFDCLS